MQANKKIDAHTFWLGRSAENLVIEVLEGEKRITSHDCF